MAMTPSINQDCSEHSETSRSRRFKDIARRTLLKQRTITSRVEPRQKSHDKDITPIRPKMGMKDSDDYITARAANPRTGLISPSLAGTPRTPESPAEALKIRAQRTRPALTRANEARKISAGGSQKWCSSGKGWSFEDAKSRIASPRPSDASAGAADIISGQLQPGDDSHADDRFVVKMPSAREPQPYAFPGRSAQEIQAFEHYRRKARKTSGDGWDQRCVQNGGIRKSSATDCERGRKRTSSNGMPGYYPARNGTVVRRGHPSFGDLDGVALSSAELHHVAASFAPYSSPKTPARKPCGGQKSKTPRILHEYAATSPLDRDDKDTAAPITHLSQLPKLHLVHPELASLPMPKLRRVADKRSCSLGCDRSPDADTCPQLASIRREVQPLFTSDEDAIPFPFEHATALLTYAVATVRAIHDKLGASIDIHIPRPAMINTLTNPDASVEEKIAASKALITVVGQVAGALMAISVVWKLLDAVVGVVGMLFWPFAVPLRMVWWLMSG